VISSPTRARDIELKRLSRAEPLNKPADHFFTHTRRRQPNERRPRLSVVNPATGEMREMIGEKGQEQALAQRQPDWSAPVPKPDPEAEDSEFEDDADLYGLTRLPLEDDIDAPRPGQLFRWRASVKRLLRGYDSIRSFDVPWERPASLPVTIVRSQNSAYFTETHAQGVVKQMFPNYRIVTYPTKSHWVHAECPQVLKWHIGALLDPLASLSNQVKMEQAGAFIGFKNV